MDSVLVPNARSIKNKKVQEYLQQGYFYQCIYFHREERIYVTILEHKTECLPVLKVIEIK